MTKVKNCSYQKVEAVLSDHSIVSIEAFQEAEVPDSEVHRLTVERYPGALQEVKEEIQTVEKVEPEIPKVEKFICNSCGLEAKSRAGLVAHFRTHKKKV